MGSASRLSPESSTNLALPIAKRALPPLADAVAESGGCGGCFSGLLGPLALAWRADEGGAAPKLDPVECCRGVMGRVAERSDEVGALFSTSNLPEPPTSSLPEPPNLPDPRRSEVCRM